MTRPFRFFVDGLTEKIIPVETVRKRMFDDLGCDPGGWAEHSRYNAATDFDVERFISTTSQIDAAKRFSMHQFTPDDANDSPVLGWH